MSRSIRASSEPVISRRPVEGHACPGVAGSARLYGVVRVVASVRQEAQRGRRSVHMVRMADIVAGEVAEVDFGRLGMIAGPATGKRKAVWVLIIVLSYSRHCFVWPTHSQKL